MDSWSGACQVPVNIKRFNAVQDISTVTMYDGDTTRLLDAMLCRIL
jgi:hypothetical protein